jgi:hypothetical protein
VVLAEHGRQLRERAGERELHKGENEDAGDDPCWVAGPRTGRGWDFRASSALPTCEARFELLDRAGLRALFCVKRAVPRKEDRANKQLVFLISLPG